MLWLLRGVRLRQFDENDAFGGKFARPILKRVKGKLAPFFKGCNFSPQRRTELGGLPQNTANLKLFVQYFSTSFFVKKLAFC
jgi:hypothetical protein